MDIPGMKKKIEGMQIYPIMAETDERSYHIPVRLRRDLDGVIATLEGVQAKAFGTKMGDRNFLLSGEPGTGKTLAVRYVATKLKIPLYDAKLVANSQHVTALFDEMRRQAVAGRSAICVINELDKFSSREEIVDPTMQQTLNTFLDELDGNASNHCIFIFGSTNKPNKIDAALRRPGRFSKEIVFMPPERDGRLAILKIHTEMADKNAKHEFKINPDDLEYVASKTFGYTGADLMGLLNEAFTNAYRDKKRTKVTRDDLAYAIKNTKPSALRDMPFKEPAIKFADIGGYEEHKEIMRRIAKGEGSNILFYGPKGTGKSHFAEGFAGEYGFNLIEVSGSQPVDKWLGETGKMLDKYLERAKHLAPCVLFFDEMESLVEQQGIASHAGSWTGLLRSKLTKPIDGVYIIGAMNHPTTVNRELVDRFVHKIYFGMPTEQEQETIWRRYLPAGDVIDPSDLVKINNGLSCRDISKASRILADYGIEPTLEAYESLIGGISNTVQDYAHVITEIGNSVDDYKRVMHLLGGKQ